MKTIAAFIVFFCFIGCNKGDDNGNSQKLHGKWELRRTEYGYSVQPVIKYSPDNGNVISFSGNDEYSRTDVTGSNDTLTTSGSYRIAHSANCNGQTVSVIYFSGGYTNNSLLIIAGDSLYFKSDSCVITDGIERTYVRID